MPRSGFADKPCSGLLEKGAVGKTETKKEEYMQQVSQQQIDAWNEEFSTASPQELLKFFMGKFGGRLALSSSLGAEDQVLADMMVKIDPEVRIFTLDTGRLFPETYQLIARTEDHYHIKMEVFFPSADSVEAMVREDGVNLFYKSLELRKKCCHVRKLEPLARAFKTLDAWVCGLRREQSVTRQQVQAVEWDGGNGLLKINPLVSWTEADVWDYVKKEGVPYNVLHDKGYPSIGCQPCTRAVAPGQDVRSGRWWWENPEQKECGLHVS